MKYEKSKHEFIKLDKTVEKLIYELNILGVCRHKKKN